MNSKQTEAYSTKYYKSDTKIFFKRGIYWGMCNIRIISDLTFHPCVGTSECSPQK
jgi:hypothetical protein